MSSALPLLHSSAVTAYRLDCALSARGLITTFTVLKQNGLPAAPLFHEGVCCCKHWISSQSTLLPTQYLSEFQIMLLFLNRQTFSACRRHAQCQDYVQSVQCTGRSATRGDPQLRRSAQSLAIIRGRSREVCRLMPC